MLIVLDEGLSVLGTHKQETLGGSVFSPVAPSGGVGRYLMVQALSQNVRLTLSNGQVPSATVGFQIVAGDFPVLIPVGTDFFPQFFREASGAILEYQWLPHPERGQAVVDVGHGAAGLRWLQTTAHVLRLLDPGW